MPKIPLLYIKEKNEDNNYKINQLYKYTFTKSNKILKNTFILTTLFFMKR